MIDDIGDFDPKKDPKYRPDIVRFLRRNRRMIAAYGPPRLVRLKYGNLLWRIGWLIDGDFIGGSLWIDKPTNRYCFVGISEQDIIAEVDWATYRRIGGCALSDWEHRWQTINRNWRRCANCHQMQRRKVVTVKTVERREIFENV